MVVASLKESRAAGLVAVFAGALAILAASAAVPVPAVGQVAPPTEPAPSQLGPGDGREDIFDLEPAVAQAELIVAVQLVDVTDTKIVHGGRTEQITQQFRLEPVRVLKGIYARDALLMTGQDLGIYQFAEGADRLRRGQLLLVLLGRQGQGYFNCNCNGVATLAQSIPRLKGEDDPLLASVLTLIKMGRERDRAARVDSLRDALKTATGRDAAPVLLALGRRPLLASQSAGVAEAIAPHLKAESPALREVAARALGAILDASPTGRGPLPETAAEAIASALNEAGPDVASRIALIDALGACGEAALRDEAASAWLDAEQAAPTLAEEAARLRALGRAGSGRAKERVGRAYSALPLDASIEMHEAAGGALVRLDPKAAGELVRSRLANKDLAGLGIAQEIATLGVLPPEFAVPGLLDASRRPLDPAERLAFAQACMRVADARLVPALSSLLDPRQYQIRYAAVDALMKIDTDEAAATLWPHLTEEADPARKLRLVAFVGRHGYRDGYALAIEHLSQDALREEAVEALAAIAEPRAIPELRRIWQTSNDLAWNASAIRALARLGQEDITPRLLEIAGTPGDPLAPSALIGLGDLGAAGALPIVRDALSSRSEALVVAATRAASKLRAQDGPDAKAVRDRLAALLTDADAPASVRQAALEALVKLDDPGLAAALAAVAREANLEGQPLLALVEQEIARKRPDTTQAAK